MNQLPYTLDFMHRFNLHKLLGLLVEDDDLRSIARIYGVKLRELKRIEEGFLKDIEEMASELREKFQPKPPEKPYVIAAIGDSLTSDRISWAKVLNHLWKEDGKRMIIDCAISGNTTSDVIDRFYSSVLNQSFQWAVLFLGTNDSRQLDDEAHISNTSLEEYRRNMTYFTETLLKKGIEVVHVTIPQVDNTRFKPYFQDSNSVYDPKLINDTNIIIRELSAKKGTHLADLAKKLEGYKGDFLSPDGIHLNRNGQMQLCELMLEILP
ncbi:MAG: SGNH/GDSL hydrolase family protein [Spirochaetota bacterium]